MGAHPVPGRLVARELRRTRGALDHARERPIAREPSEGSVSVDRSPSSRAANPATGVTGAEVDEETAIFKVTNGFPTQGHFVGLEGLPSDAYLRIAGEGTRTIHRAARR